jgi:hypothetical protein
VEFQVLALTPSRVGLVLQYFKDQPTKKIKKKKEEIKKKLNCENLHYATMKCAKHFVTISRVDSQVQ